MPAFAAGWIGFQISQRRTAPDPPPIAGVEAQRAFAQGDNYERRGSTLRNMEVAERMYRRALHLEATQDGVAPAASVPTVSGVVTLRAISGAVYVVKAQMVPVKKILAERRGDAEGYVEEQ